ncbi:hypothetical protein [Kitasatospora sp. MAP5-34]|uniref:hypothetical protein n=1 Tax=Kitasatospora sp. MAP5-34 TaxID=3035102 RepID=UPI002476E7D6|nr:hypothetical protein [Kitasatospora sp. MAP5-34]MDH6574564.1 hypothetical protein [Kitasatospora sp. MAP5-34]
MKKRSMLAVASLAAGVVASLTAPSAHASSAQRGTDLPGAPGVLSTAGLHGVIDAARGGGETPHDLAAGRPDRPRH